MLGELQEIKMKYENRSF